MIRRALHLVPKASAEALPATLVRSKAFGEHQRWLRTVRSKARGGTASITRRMIRRFDRVVDRAADSLLTRKFAETTIGQAVTPWTWGRRGLTIGVGIILGILAIVVSMKSYIAKQTASVTTTALQDEDLLAEVKNKLSALVTQLTNDTQTRKDVLGLLDMLLREPTTQKALTDLVVWTLQDERTRAACAGFLRDAQVQAGLGGCIRGGLWHTVWPAR